MATKKMTLGNSSTIVNLEANGTVVGSNIKNKGNSAKPVYFDNDGNAVPIENELVTYEVSETEPTDPNVGIWLKKEQESVFVPTMDDFNELENKVDELNMNISKYGDMELLIYESTTDSYGNVLLNTNGHRVVLAAATNTVDTKTYVFLNSYGLWYLNISQVNGNPYTGRFKIWVLVA